jgi:hypothetical protein
MLGFIDFLYGKDRSAVLASGGKPQRGARGYAGKRVEGRNLTARRAGPADSTATIASFCRLVNRSAYAAYIDL